MEACGLRIAQRIAFMVLVPLKESFEGLEEHELDTPSRAFKTVAYHSMCDRTLKRHHFIIRRIIFDSRSIARRKAEREDQSPTINNLVCVAIQSHLLWVQLPFGLLLLRLVLLTLSQAC